MRRIVSAPPRHRLRRLWLLFAVLAAVALAGRGIARAGSRHDNDDRHYAALLETNAARLGLSESTLGQIRQIFADADTEHDALRSQIEAAHGAMRTLLSQPRPDDAAVMQQADFIGSLETALLKQRLRTLLRVRPLLTSAQITELEKIRDERRASVTNACNSEINGTCPDAHGRALIDCLRRHETTLSQPCRDALHALRPQN